MPWFAFTIVIFCIFFVIAPAVPSSPLLPSSGAGLLAALCPCPLWWPGLPTALPAPPLLGALAAFRRGWQGVHRPPTHPPVCVLALRVGVWSPHRQPPRCALTWVPVCSEGRPVTLLLGSCNPRSSVSAASVAFPRKGSWAEATSSASLSPWAAGGWSSGDNSLGRCSSGSAVSAAGHRGQFSPCSRPSERVGWCLLSRLRSSLKYLETWIRLPPPGAPVTCVVGASPTFFLPVEGALSAFLLPAVCWSCSMLCAILCPSLLPVVSVIGSHLMGPFYLVAHVFPVLVLRFGPWSPVCVDHPHRLET